MSGTIVRSPGRKGTPPAEPQPKLPQTVAEVLNHHAVLETESIDRMYLNVFVGRLQILEGALRFIRQQRKAKVLSTNAVEPMTRAFVQAIEQFVKDQQILMVTFEKGRRKDEVAAQFRAKFVPREGVVFVDKAQEKCTIYRTEKRHNPKKKHQLCLDRQIHRSGEPTTSSTVSMKTSARFS